MSPRRYNWKIIVLISLCGMIGGVLPCFVKPLWLSIAITVPSALVLVSVTRGWWLE